jgi:hypothetical protein
VITHNLDCTIPIMTVHGEEILKLWKMQIVEKAAVSEGQDYNKYAQTALSPQSVIMPEPCQVTL